MPIYEYRCRACGAEFEKLQRSADAAPPPCPACAGPDVGRRVSLSAFQLKGTGWYTSDYKPAPPEAKADTATAGAGSAGAAAPAATPSGTASATSPTPGPGS